MQPEERLFAPEELMDDGVREQTSAKGRHQAGRGSTGAKSRTTVNETLRDQRGDRPPLGVGEHGEGETIGNPSLEQDAFDSLGLRVEHLASVRR